jgi:hypothetical protein
MFNNNPRVQWLSEWNGQRERAQIYQENHSAWTPIPTTTQWRNNMMPLKRTSNLTQAMRYKWDWTFELPDEGAATVWLEGSASSKGDFLIYLGSTLSDASGYYVLLGRSGVRVLETIKGAIHPTDGSMFAIREQGVRDKPGVRVSGKAGALQTAGLTCFTFIYNYGTFSLFEGNDPNRPGKILAQFVDPRPVSGVTRYGFGMLGDSEDVEQVDLASLQRWSRPSIAGGSSILFR